MVTILHKIQGVLTDIPRWGLLVLLVLAPWNYGSTRPLGKLFLTQSLLVVLGFFVLSLIAKWRLPKLNIVSALLTGLLLLQGWIMVLNPKQSFDPAVFAFTNLAQGIPWFPGVVDQATSESQLLLVTGLIGAFWIAGDLASSNRWRMRTWWAMSLSGISLVVLGLAQRLTGATAIFWEPATDSGPTFFATYRYHANAGAFLNLVLPLIAAQAALAFLRGSSDASKTFWSVATLMTIASAFVNVSRAAMVITAFLVLVLACQRLNASEFKNWSRSRVLFFGVIFFSLSVGLVWACGFGDSLARWIDPQRSDTYTSRWLVDETIARSALPVSGWWGFGSGTFQITFPFFTQELGDRVAGIWQNAHQDYLQGLMEWGYVGGTLWAALLFGGLGLAIARHLKKRRFWDSDLRLFSSACILSIGGLLLHAMVDFPLQIPSLQLYGAVIIGFLWNLSDSRSQKKRRSRTRTSRGAMSPEMNRPVLPVAHEQILYRKV